jgi:accessory colonization factor AcfC
MNQTKFEKETKVFEQNQAKMNEQMNEISKMRQKIANYYSNSENSLDNIAGQRNQLHQKVEAFLHEYQF